MLYVTDPSSPVIGLDNMAVEWGHWSGRTYTHKHVNTVRNAISSGELVPYDVPRQGGGGPPLKATIAGSLWCVQSRAWVRDVAASQRNGACPVRESSRPRGRPRIELSSGTSAQARIGTTLVAGSPLIT